MAGISVTRGSKDGTPIQITDLDEIGCDGCRKAIQTLKPDQELIDVNRTKVTVGSNGVLYENPKYKADFGCVKLEVSIYVIDSGPYRGISTDNSTKESLPTTRHAHDLVCTPQFPQR